jgi:hypothetical protein
MKLYLFSYIIYKLRKILREKKGTFFFNFFSIYVCDKKNIFKNNKLKKKKKIFFEINNNVNTKKFPIRKFKLFLSE